MKNYKIEIKGTMPNNNITNTTTNNFTSEANKLKLQLRKRENIIQKLFLLLSELKTRTNLKNENLENLLTTLKLQDYEKLDISKLDLNELLPPTKHILNINQNEILVKERYKNLHYDILKYLNPKDLVSIGMTCKTFHKIINQSYYWEKIYFKDFDIFLFLNERDQCEVLSKAKEQYINYSQDQKKDDNINSFDSINSVNSINTVNSINSVNSKLKNLNFKSKFLELKRLNKNWETERPVVTTISTSESVTCLHLDAKSNQMIYSLSDGSASQFRLYSYRKIACDEELYMQHHKQTRICDKVSSFHGHGGSIWCMDRSDEILFTGSYDKTIKLWRTKTGECLATLRAHDSWVSSINYDSKFETIVSGSWDSSIKLWNIKTLQSTLKLNSDAYNYIYCVRSNLSENEIIAGNEWKNIDIWDVNKKVRSVILTGHTERVNNLKVEDNLIFSGSEDKTAGLWDKRSGACEIVFTGHTKGITQIEYDSFNWRVFTASNDKTIKIWDIRKNIELRTLIGHSDAVSSIAFDQTKLISGSKDNSIRIWNFLN